MSDAQKIAAPGWMLELSVFVCGALVMIYEINGSRIVAPFIGTSTYVWTSLIGVILGALSLGYWVGGRTADLKPNVGVLASAIFTAGGLVSFTILFKDVILSFVARSPFGLEIRSVIAALFLFAPASVALGFVIPYATKLRMQSIADTGKTVGRLYALSTIGSIAGTFAAGFFLLPFVGSVRTLYLIAAALFAVSILLAGVSLTRINIVFLTVFAFGITASETGSYYLRRANNLYDIDTQYSRLSVFDGKHPVDGRPIKALSTDPVSIQSARFLDSDELALEYTRFYHLISHYRPDFRRSLMIGGAGFSYPQEYLRSYPEAQIDVVEIDPKMTDIAREFFGLQNNERLKIFHEDGRVFLNNAPVAAYDAVLMDAFGSRFSVPYQLTTVEAVGQIHRVLNDNGVVIFNLGSAIHGPASYFARAELATYRAVFADVHLYKVHADNPNEQLQNLMIVACKIKCNSDLPQTADTTEFDGTNLNELLANRYTGELPADLPILTDDLAPVERFNSLAHSYK